MATRCKGSFGFGFLGRLEGLAGRTHTHTWKASSFSSIGYFESIPGYFGVQWLVVLGKLAFQEGCQSKGFAMYGDLLTFSEPPWAFLSTKSHNDASQALCILAEVMQTIFQFHLRNVKCIQLPHDRYKSIYRDNKIYLEPYSTI